MKKLKLGMHTYTLHLWGLGQNWGIVAEPRPKDINLMQLMDMAVDWGLDGLHITGCDLETKEGNFCRNQRISGEEVERKIRMKRPVCYVEGGPAYS